MAGLGSVQPNRIDVSAKPKVWDFTAATLRCDTPIIAGDAANKAYVDAHAGGGGGVWGTITGTLSNQVDLQAALDDKYDDSNPDGFVSDLTSFDTDDLDEGGTNLYFTDARAVTALTGENISIFTNDSGFITGVDWDEIAGTQTDVNLSGFTNDSGFVTAGSIDWATNVPLNETDPVFAAWLAVPPNISVFTNDAGYLTSVTGALSLDQTVPQTFTAGTVTGTGLLSVTAGQLGLDTNAYITGVTWSAITGTQTDVNLSGFTNDSGFVTGVDWGEITGTQTDVNLSGFTNDSNFITAGAIDWATNVPLNETDPVFSAWLAVPPNISIFTNDSGFVTAGSIDWATNVPLNETDPVFAAWLAVPPNISVFTNDSGFITSVAWGDITGTLANQTDLQDALDLKYDASNPDSYITGAEVPANETDPVFSAWLAVPPNVSVFTNDSAYITDISSFSINDLSDVSAAAPTKNYVLKWNGSAWVPAVYNASFTFSISTFTCNAGGSGTVFEIGAAGTWQAIGAISFSATYNNGPASGGYVTHTGWGNLTLTGGSFEGPTSNTEVVVYPSVGGNRQFTDHATDGVDAATKTVTYYFYNRRFWGVSTTASGYVEADIEGLANNELSNSRSKTFTVAPGASDYIIYSYPSRLGTATFTVGGFAGGFQSPETVSVTNASGYTENYYVYRSTNVNLGSTTVVVS